MKIRQSTGFTHVLPLLIIAALVVVAGGIAYSRIYQDTGAPTVTDTPTSVVAPEAELSSSTLYYAYEEPGIIKARSYNAVKDEKKDLLTLENNDTEPRGGEYNTRKTELDLNDSNSQLLYTTDEGLYTYTISNQDTRREVILYPDASVEFDPGGGGSNRLRPALEFTGPGLYSIFSPSFTDRKGIVTFILGHHEGSSLAVLDIDSASYIDIGNTFEYIPEILLSNDSFTPIALINDMANYGITSNLLFEEEGPKIDYAVYGKNKRNLYGFLCKAPTSSETVYLDSFTCQESSPSVLVGVSIVDGDITELNTAVASAQISIYSEKIYASKSATSIAVLNMTGVEQSTINIAAISKVKASDVVSYRIEDVQKPVVSIFHEDEERGEQVTVIDLVDKTVLGNFKLGLDSSFSVLGVDD